MHENIARHAKIQYVLGICISSLPKASPSFGRPRRKENAKMQKKTTQRKCKGIAQSMRKVPFGSWNRLPLVRGPCACLSFEISVVLQTHPAFEGCVPCRNEPEVLNLQRVNYEIRLERCGRRLFKAYSKIVLRRTLASVSTSFLNVLHSFLRRCQDSSAQRSPSPSACFWSSSGPIMVGLPAVLLR